MLRQLISRLTALTICAALALGTMTPAPAAAEDRSEERQGSENAAGLLILGIAAAALITHLNTKNRDDDDDGDRRPERQEHGDRGGRGAEANREDDDGPRIVIPPPDNRALPISCVNRVLSPDGTITPLYIHDCLRREGVDVNRLPQGCYREVMGRQNNLRRGYVTRCLARHGYYSPDLR